MSVYQLDEEQRASLTKTLQRAEDALDDWINTYASDLCDPARVAEAKVRIYDGGGTLHYIACVLVEVRAAKKFLSE